MSETKTNILKLVSNYLDTNETLKEKDLKEFLDFTTIGELITSEEEFEIVKGILFAKDRKDSKTDVTSEVSYADYLSREKCLRDVEYILGVILKEDSKMTINSDMQEISLEAVLRTKSKEKLQHIRKMFSLLDLQSKPSQRRPNDQKTLLLSTSELEAIMLKFPFIDVSLEEIQQVLNKVGKKDTKERTILEHKDYQQAFLAIEKTLLEKETNDTIEQTNESVEHVKGNFNDIMKDMELNEAESLEASKIVQNHARTIHSLLIERLERDMEESTSQSGSSNFFFILIDRILHVEDNIGKIKRNTESRRIMEEFLVEHYHRVNSNYSDLQEDFKRLFNNFHDKLRLVENAEQIEQAFITEKEEMSQIITRLNKDLRDKEKQIRDLTTSENSNQMALKSLKSDLDRERDKADSLRMKYEKSRKQYDELIDEIWKKIQNEQSSHETKVLYKSLVKEKESEHLRY